MAQNLSVIQKIEKISTGERVFQQMKDNILNGIWKRGEKIPSENELAKAFNVSRNTVRSAIQRLSALELLVTKHGVGTTVAESAYSKNSLDPAPVIPMDWKELLEIYEFRCRIEGAFIKLAAQNRDKNDLQKLKKWAEECEDKRHKAMRHEKVNADINFHISIAEASKNKTYYNIVMKMRDIWIAQMNMSGKYIWDKKVKDYHILMYKAILEKDGKKAARYLEQSMRCHLGIIVSQMKKLEQVNETQE